MISYIPAWLIDALDPVGTIYLHPPRRGGGGVVNLPPKLCATYCGHLCSAATPHAADAIDMPEAQY